ncbi:MAG: hypothetical protein LBI17_03580 [Rickettsiales bacterium]|nr:hypothetical protein [Rickettsiales bacterium]
MKKALLGAALLAIVSVAASAQGVLVIDGKVYNTECAQTKLKNDCLPKGGESAAETIRVPSLGVRLKNCPALETCK